MIAAREVPAPTPRELRAATFAALAESGIVYLPAHMIATESGGTHVGVLVFAPLFIAAFVGGVVLACRFRAWSNIWFVAGGISVAVGLALGHGDMNRSVFTVALVLLVCLRVLTLGLRDWRSPIQAEFGWGAVALGFEAILSAGPQPNWKPALVLFVPLFFIGSLASRATTVWTASASDELSDETRAGWLRRALLVTGGLVVAMAAAVGLGVRGGVFDQIGAWLAPLGNGLAELLTWTLSQLARPIFWLVDQLHIDPRGVREFLESLRIRASRAAHQSLAPSPYSFIQRILGLLAFAGVVYMLFRVIRRFRPEISAEPAVAGGPATISVSDLGETPVPAPALFRRELPADAVRRWYAEILIELERRQLPKDPARTPAEFAPDVALAFPECSEPFRALTRAYEDVRYGSLVFDRGELKRLEGDHRAVMAALKRAPKPTAEPERRSDPSI